MPDRLNTGLKILAIDDEEEVCNVAKKVLDLARIAVTAFACMGDIEKGLEWALQNQPDIILLDLNLMGSSYPEMTIARIPEFHKIGAVIVLTGKVVDAADKLFKTAVLNGAVDVLYKPEVLTVGNEGKLAKALAIALASRKRVLV